MLPIVAAGAYVLYVVWNTLRHPHQPNGLTLDRILCLMAIMWASWIISKHERSWRRPLALLNRLLPRVRAGDLPMTQLDSVDGKMAPVAGQIQQLLREIRQGQADMAQLNHEIRQRVAQRTTALERLVGSLRQQASRDGLTGLFNRRMLDEHLPQVVERCRTDREPLSLLMIDVDNFKLVNDTLGHTTGDNLLTEVGQLIRSHVREQDLAFRFGGDEFVILLPGMKTSEAQALANRLVTLMDQIGKALDVPRHPRLSIGVCSLEDLDHPTADTLLERADKMLYTIKFQHKRGQTAA